MNSYEKAHEVLSAFDETPVHETIQQNESYNHRLDYLHNYEPLLWDAVERGDITAEEAEDALWDAIEWCEQASEL